MGWPASGEAQARLALRRPATLGVSRAHAVACGANLLGSGRGGAWARWRRHSTCPVDRECRLAKAAAMGVRRLTLVAMPPTTPLPGRNEPCHCGSGRKYKHCCLEKDHAEDAAARTKAAEAAATSSDAAVLDANPAAETKIQPALENEAGSRFSSPMRTPRRSADPPELIVHRTLWTWCSPARLFTVL